MGLSVRAVTIALCFAAALSGCSKKQNTSTVSLSLPNWPSKASLSKASSGPEAMATVENIAVIILNIKGPGMPAPAVFQWERHDNQTATPPSSVELTVPRGSDRLIQVLVVFEEADGSDMQFHYGDVVANLAAEFNSVGVTVQPIGGETGGGSITGRYLDASGKGPTGPVEISFQPPSGGQRMVIDTGFIVEGWFSFFALATNGLTYRHIGTNTFLFENYKTGSAAPVGSQQAKVKLSQYWYYESFDNSGNPTGSKETSPEQISIVGYFGPGGAGKSVCFDNSSIELNGAFANSIDGDVTKVNWVGNANGTGSIGAGQAGVTAGGTLTCGSDTDKFNSFLKIDSTLVTDREGMLGFRGLFVLQDSGGSGGYKQSILASRATDSVTLNWKYLNGVTGSNGIGGAAVYYRVGVESVSGGKADYGDSDGIHCEDLPLKGFNLWQEVAAGLADTQGTSTIVGITDTMWNEGKFQAVVCPYLRTPIAGKSFLPEGGVDFRAYQGGGNMGGGYVPTKLAAFKREAGSYSQSTSTSPVTARAGTCVPVEVVAVDDAGNYGATSSSLTINISSPAGGEQVSTNSDCSSSSDNVSIYTSNGRSYFYVADYGTTGTVTINMVDPGYSGTPLDPGVAYLNFVPAVPATSIQTYAATSIRAFDCFPVIYRSEAAGVVSNLSSLVNLTFPGGSDWLFYSHPNCVNPVTGSSLGPSPTPGASQLALSARFIGAGAGTFSLAPTANSAPELTAAGATIAAKTVSVTQPSPPVKLSWTGVPSSLAAEQCVGIHVQLQDSAGQGTPLKTSYITTGTTMTINMTSDNGDFYYYSGCNSGGATSTHIQQYNSFSNIIYFKPSVSGPVNLSATATGLQAGVNISNATFTIAASVAVANRVSVGFPGQVWNPTNKTFDGQPYAMLRGETYPVELRALTPSSNLDAAFNRVLSDINFRAPYGGSVNPFSLSAWSGGAATLLMSPSSAGGLTINTGGGSTGLNDHPQPYLNVMEANSFALFIKGSFERDACQPLLIQSSYGGMVSSAAIPVSSPTTVTISALGLTSPGEESNVQFFDGTDQDCNGAVVTTSTTVTFAPGESQKLLFVRTSVISVSNIELTSTAAGSLARNAIFSTTPGSAGTEQSLFVLGRTSITPQHCHGFVLYRGDSAGNASPGDEERTIELSAPYSGTFYASPDCAAGANPSLVFANNESSKLFYFKPTAPYGTSGTFSISFQTTGATPASLNVPAESIAVDNY